jgi:uncharacterized protein (DUF433 family)
MNQDTASATGQLTRADLHHQLDRLSPERLAVIERSPEVLGGLSVVRGTRVPARVLLDYLAAGDSLDTFLDDFPSVRREQALALLALSRDLLAGQEPA